MLQKKTEMSGQLGSVKNVFTEELEIVKYIKEIELFGFMMIE